MPELDHLFLVEDDTVTIGEHLTHFAGKPVRDFDPAAGIKTPTRVIYRVRLTWDEADQGESLADRLALFLDDPAVEKIPGLVIGCWIFDSSDDSTEVVETLVAARDKMPNLRALFLGDITFEEQEISWIRQSDVSPLLAAFPQLEVFRVRGNEGLVVGKVRHAQLKELTIETGGLSAAVVQDVLASNLPALEHLELWLGTPDYGGDVTLADLKPVLSGKKFPRLQYLGLRDSEMADDVATAVATAPVLARLKVLDLSLGNLSDVGAQALLASPAVAQLEKLDIHHHYVSKPVVKQLKALGIQVDDADPQEPDTYDGEEHRYIAVGE